MLDISGGERANEQTSVRWYVVLGHTTKYLLQGMIVRRESEEDRRNEDKVKMKRILPATTRTKG